MIDERDRELNMLFAQADDPLDGDAFVARTMTSAKSGRRKRVLNGIILTAAILVVAVFFAAPLQHAAVLVANGLATPLLPINNPVLAALLLPVNSIAAPCALAFVVLRAARRRLFR